VDFTPSLEALFLDPSSVPLPQADDEDMADDNDDEESPQAVPASMDPATKEEEAPERERK
jgi:hypothetical protein